MGKGPFGKGKECARKTVIGFTGDVNALDYGGGIVYRWKNGNYTYTTWEFWSALPEGSLPSEKYLVYRVDVPNSVLKEYCTPDSNECNIHGCGPTLRTFPKKCTCPKVSIRHKGNWVYIPKVASYVGVTPLEWAKSATAAAPVMSRVRCMDDIASYWGPENLDSYPIELTASEIKRRWKNHMRRGRWKNAP